jgi:hypothetical protein
MPKWSLRDLVAKRTEKKTLDPQMRDMLLSLDGVYETRPRVPESPSGEAREVASSEAAADDRVDTA